MSSDKISIQSQATVEPGTYLFHAKGDKRLTNIPIKRYRISVSGGLDQSVNPQTFTQSAAYWLDQEHGTPVGSAGTMHVVSMTDLSRSVNVKDYRVTPEKVGELTLTPDTPSGREQIKKLVQSSLRRAIPDSLYSFQFLQNVVRREVEFGGEGFDFGAQRKHAVKVHITADGTVLLQVEASHNLITMQSLDEMISEDDNLPSWRVEHDTEIYDNSSTGRLLGWSDLRYNDRSDSLGEVVSEYHKGIIDEDIRQNLIEKNPRLVKVDYGNFPGDQVPRALKLSPRTEQVEQQDYEFHRLFTSKRAMKPNKRYEYMSTFVEDLPPLPGFNLNFDPNPSNHGFNFIDIREDNSQLVYGDGAHASKPSTGLKNHGVFKPPGDYWIGILYPSNFEDTFQEFIGLLARTLSEWGAPAGTSGYAYELGKISEYTDVYRQLRDETDVVVAMVPNKGAADSFGGVEDPHNELKRTLSRQGIPTQMFQKSTADDIVKSSQKLPSDSFTNIVSAVVAKAGGTPWQIREMPGKTQAFMGLDVTRDSNTGQHSGASASIVMRDGSTFAAESTTQQAGEKFISDQVEQFVRDLVFDFADEQGESLGRLTIFRDGKIHEDVEEIRDGLSSLDAKIDIVGIRKRDQTRISNYDGTKFNIADKGVGFVDREREQGILHAFGKPETDDDNRIGTPRTLRLIKDSGPTDIETITRQAYWLSEIHYGSPARSTRLPVPIKYADMAAEYVRKGYVDPGQVIQGPAYL